MTPKQGPQGAPNCSTMLDCSSFRLRNLTRSCTKSRVSAFRLRPHILWTESKEREEPPARNTMSISTFKDKPKVKSLQIHFFFPYLTFPFSTFLSLPSDFIYPIAILHYQTSQFPLSPPPRPTLQWDRAFPTSRKKCELPPPTARTGIHLDLADQNHIFIAQGKTKHGRRS